MFLPNDVVHYAAPARTLRILWIDADRGLAYCFELGATRALPHAASLGTMAADVAGGRARLLASDPFAARPAPSSLPQKHRDLQAKAWAIVSSLHARAPALYDARERAALVAACAHQHGVSKPSILRYLRRYWERGQTVDALVPDYGNSGARGKTRGASEGVKRGRPSTTRVHAGPNIDLQMRAIFRAAAARHAAMHAESSRRAAYRQMLADFYPGRPAAELPSFGQFNYWLNRDAAPGAPD